MRRLMKRFGVAVSVAAVVLSLSASAALAGEVTGNGTSLKPLQANSECAFSGLNDEYYIDGIVTDPRTQSWGQIPKADRDFLTSIGVTPSALCNGHLNPLR